MGAEIMILITFMTKPQIKSTKGMVDYEGKLFEKIDF